MKALACSLLLMMAGCAHRLTFTNFDTGEILKGTANLAKTIRVTMKDGEVVEGKYSAVSSDSVAFGFGSATAFSGAQMATAFGSGTTIMAGGPGRAYAILRSTTLGSKLMMELLVSYNALSGHGFGEARTNDGRSYRVTF